MPIGGIFLMDVRPKYPIGGIFSEKSTPIGGIFLMGLRTMCVHNACRALCALRALIVRTYNTCAYTYIPSPMSSACMQAERIIDVPRPSCGWAVLSTLCPTGIAMYMGGT